MEELKILVESIAGLPDLAIYVVAMYFIFKLAIVGSIYGVIRYVTMKLHDWSITKKTTVEEVKIVKENVLLNINNRIISHDCDSQVKVKDMEDLFDAIKVYGNKDFIFNSDIKGVIKLMEGARDVRK